MQHHHVRWTDAVHQLNQQGTPYVLVTVMGTRGSTPRAAGTKMVITADAIYDTIGGGHLEFKAVTRAQSLLEAGEAGQCLEHFPLGPSLGQCCGGRTSLLFEAFVTQTPEVTIFGAGHVSQALVSILQELPLRIRVVDSRREWLPTEPASNVVPVLADYPADEIRNARPNGLFVIMTHNHQLDFELCEALLKRGDAHFIGLIGSETKWARFQQRLNFKGYAEEAIASLTCPVGVLDIPGKRPMEVAVSIAGQIIQQYHALNPEPSRKTQGLQWDELKDVLPNTETHNA